MNRKLAAVGVVALMILAACGNDDEDGAAGGDGGGDDTGCTVGVSWFTFQEERYGLRDEPGIRAAIEAGGGRYIGNDGQNSAERQATNVENLISQNVDVLVINPFDAEAIKPSVAAAQAAGIPVVAYDRLIEDEDVLYLTHNSVEVGRMIARQVTDEVPEGNYAIIKGDQANPNVVFLSQGFSEVIDPMVADGRITVVGEEYSENWAPEVAQTNMEQILTANDNDIDAVLSHNDGMAGGVIAALALQGLDGQVVVGGQDGDLAALNRVALGTQSVSVWKDATELGTAAGEAALQLCEDPDPNNVAGAEPFETPEGNTVSAILLAPIPITSENLDIVLDAEWIDQDTLCQDVPAGSVDACP
jgi:D-xylose transport system substrate-binding protein